MEIRGNKVILRTMEEQDQEMLLGLIQDQEITRVTGGYSSPSSYEPQIQWPCSWEDSADSLRSIIADKENPEIGLGIILLSHVDPQNGIAELSIKLGNPSEAWGMDRMRSIFWFPMDSESWDLTVFVLISWNPTQRPEGCLKNVVSGRMGSKRAGRARRGIAEVCVFI